MLHGAVHSVLHKGLHFILKPSSSAHTRLVYISLQININMPSPNGAENLPEDTELKGDLQIKKGHTQDQSSGGTQA